jgi:conjugation system TraG family ATPase
MAPKKMFEKPFIGTSVYDDVTILFSRDGNYSVVMAIENKAMQYASDPRDYEEYHQLLGQCIKILGPQFILQKTDIIARKAYRPPTAETPRDYLQEKYFQHFAGRSYRALTSLLTITRQHAKGRFFTYDPREVKDFIQKIHKVRDAFHNHKLSTSILDEQALDRLHDRYMAFHFTEDRYPLGNIRCDEEGLYMGAKSLKVVSLIDIDELNIPTEITAYAHHREGNRNYPKDHFSFLLSIPECDTVLFNQVIFIPDQLKLKRELELKKKRHHSMPDPANKLSVADIEDMFIDIAQDNELLVYSHFSFLVQGESDTLGKALNYIDSQLFAMGIIPGKNTYNQMELFRAAIPGNADELKPYDKFLTSRPAALSFLFKEAIPGSEPSRDLLYFTDRQGIPIGIDCSELPMQTNRIQNRNKFILGPSGSGKSFFTNSYVKQCRALGADVILVDTGHSYAGLCTYFNGKYITYEADKPITMNPFRIELIELNDERRQFMISLVGVIWKGQDGIMTPIEETILLKVMSDYYADYFGERNKVEQLCFNSFYEFALERIDAIMRTEKIPFALDEFRFVLQKFYRGGEYEKILNDDFDNSLFNEPFIVFEIDSIKEHKLLFPITTLIIMGVFIQKMRYKKNKKILIIEEAWKAIASPIMANYIVYVYKTVRKFAGEAIVVTQELDDIIGNPVVKKSIIANSDTICLLDQYKFKDNFEEIARLLSLSEVEKAKIFTINRLDNKEQRARFKEVYIKRGATGEVYGIEVPLEEYLTYTTERSEKEALGIYQQQYSPFQTALDHMVSDFRSSGKDWMAFIRHINDSNQVFKTQ